MLPVPPLPYATFAFGAVTLRALLASLDPSGELRLDQSPPIGEISISRRQCPDGMQVVRPHNDGLHAKRVARLNRTKRGSQQIDSLGEQVGSAVGQIDGEEKTPAGHEIAPVVGHRQKIEQNVRSMQLNRWGSAQGASTHPTGSYFPAGQRTGGAQR